MDESHGALDKSRAQLFFFFGRVFLAWTGKKMQRRRTGPCASGL